jgi:FixJ family two-component response regulator
MNVGPLLIAVVDDDEGIRASLQHLLRAAGFRTVSFGSAEELLAFEDRDAIACVVIDVNLPGMNGAALAGELRAEGTGTPIVLISARDDPGTLALVRRSGDVPFLRKPFGDEDLLSAIARSMNQ